MNTGILLSFSACIFAQFLKAVGVSYMHGTSFETKTSNSQKHQTLTTGSIRMKPFFSSGGMPSSHSALVTCMACWTMFAEGVNSGAACVAVCVAAIVCYDASHVRLEVGKHASQINRILSVKKGDNISPTRKARYQAKSIHVSVDIESKGELDEEDDTALLIDTQRGEHTTTIHDLGQRATKLLEEAVGHTKIEVVAGVAVGILWFLLWLPVLMYS